MTNKQRPQRDEIRELLRQGDPAGNDRGLGADEAARMRRRIVTEATTRKAPLFRPIPALAAAAIIILVVATGWRFLRPEVPAGPDGSKTAAVPGPAAPERRTRQVQFLTPGGTRIIWLLDSEFEV
ncbi:MAG: hypothetical protein IH848_10145 [Acidobacteria bacterium]|nr:hypothetical protein [Acidobacteriota bacterium]